jgi:hypothetical protein
MADVDYVPHTHTHTHTHAHAHTHTHAHAHTHTHTHADPTSFLTHLISSRWVPDTITTALGSSTHRTFAGTRWSQDGGIHHLQSR